MIKIILNGCYGKMCSVIDSIVSQDTQCEVVAGFDVNIGDKKNYPVFKNPREFTADADVVIDFSHPTCLEGLLDYCKLRKLPAVICTTGLSSAQIDLIKKTSSQIPLFFSANMSLGVNLLIDLVKRAARVLQDFDIEIIEKHHNQKIDAPSGTALAIADAISTSLDYEPEYIYDRHSQRKKRDKHEIGLHAIRGGTIVGDHDVIFAGNNEILTISHSASSKEVFAVGAVRAAKFISAKPAGLYSMTQLVESFGNSER